MEEYISQAIDFISSIFMTLFAGAFGILVVIGLIMVVISIFFPPLAPFTFAFFVIIYVISEIMK